MAPEPFEFLDVALLADRHLQLILTDRLTAAQSPWRVPAYGFAMQSPDGEHIGRIGLRVGWREDVIRYAGHVGYSVEPAHRGHGYAERGCRLIVSLAKQHGMTNLWITCQPDNVPSRRTLERLGAEFIEIIDVPPDYPLQPREERRKMCFSLKLE